MPKPIECPPGRIYTDTRDGTGGSVFCKLGLPGSLEVRDGPFRFWFNADLEGATGSYKLGRELGKWKECNRFGGCEQKDYPELDPDERQRPGVKPEVPITYTNGKYLFDFGSCRRTAMVHTKGNVTDLLIGSEPDGCHYDYSTRKDIVFQDDMQTLQFGHPKQRIDCKFPFQLDKKAFASLDLMSELPNQGLPQYCEEMRYPPEPPYFADVNPTGEKGVTSVFTATFDVGNNGVGIGQARLHFQKNAASRTDRCVVRYDPSTRSFFLNSDEPGKYLGPIAAGGNDSLWNQECLLASCSNAQLVSTTLTVKFAVRFNPVNFAGVHEMFLEMVDTQKHATPAGSSGEWTVPAGESVSPGAPWPSDRSCPVTSTAPE